MFHFNSFFISIKQQQAQFSPGPWTWWSRCTPSPCRGRRTSGRRWARPCPCGARSSWTAPPAPPPGGQPGRGRRTAYCSYKHNKYFSARANIFYLSNPHIPDAVELATIVADLLPTRRVPLQQSENNLGRCHVRLTMTIKIYFSINYSLISFIFPASVSFREQMRTVREL